MATRRLICAIPRKRRRSWFRRRHAVLAGLALAILVLTGLTSSYGAHTAAFYIAACLMPLICCARSSRPGPMRSPPREPPEG